MSTPVPVVPPLERRHLTEHEADARYVMNKSMILWIGGFLALCGGVVFFTIDTAKGAAAGPVKEVQAVAKEAKDLALDAKVDVRELRSEFNEEISQLRTEVSDIKTRVGDSEIRIKSELSGKLDNLTNNFNTYITNQAGKDRK